MTSASEIKNVVLIGANGNLGRILLSALVQSKYFQVTVVNRVSSSDISYDGVIVVKSAFTQSDLAKVFAGQDAIVSAVGAEGFNEQKTFIDAAIEAGVKRFIPSEFSTNTLSDAVLELVPLFNAKKAVLDYLKEKESTGMTWTGLAGGLLLDWGLQAGFLGFDLAGKKATIWDDGNTPYSATSKEDIGKATVSILRNSSETANRYLHIATATVTQNAILDAVQNRTGENWSVERVSTDKQTALGRQLVSQGDFTGMLLLVQASA
ncbi:NmrA-like family protein [Dendryphion nanum]|uniref:NmrA-like family protein n=1 Tax=Dendryphion nanum TaxID=256645 RepID=A0A9P9IN16_9PLEO|nr:NmrA-like family protein [Dendryphion nanum]